MDVRIDGALAFEKETLKRQGLRDWGLCIDICGPECVTEAI